MNLHNHTSLTTNEMAIEDYMEYLIQSDSNAQQAFLSNFPEEEEIVCEQMSIQEALDLVGY